MLKRTGYTVAQATSTEGLNTLLSQQRFDVIIYDVRLDPDLHLLRQHHTRLKQANTGLIITAFNSNHQQLCEQLELRFATICPTAVTRLQRLVESLCLGGKPALKA